MNPIAAITQRVTKLSWVTGLICAALILGAGAATAAVRFDAAERKVVLRGVTVGGIALDGMEFGEARRRLLEKFDKPLDRKIAVEVSGQPQGSVTPRELGVSTNVEDVYDKAVALHGKLPMWKRIWYRITGMSIGHDLAVRTAFDEGRTKAFVATLGKSVNRPPKDASVSLVGGSPKIASEVPGVALDEKAALKAIKETLSSRERTAKLETTSVPAQIESNDIKNVLVIKVGENKLSHYSGEQLVKTYDVATGLPKYPTPKGQFKIVNKRFRPTWVNPAKAPGKWGEKLPAKIPPGPNNPLGTRAMDLNARGIRIHGTSSLGSIGFNASHGCIRMRMSDVEELFSLVDVGTPVIIVQSAPFRLQTGPRTSSSLDALAESDGTAIPGQSVGRAPAPPPPPAISPPAPMPPEPVDLGDVTEQIFSDN
jgi:lipoprotein-anchoring transpeptidase ErfK/SrfK